MDENFSIEFPVTESLSYSKHRVCNFVIKLTSHIKNKIEKINYIERDTTIELDIFFKNDLELNHKIEHLIERQELIVNAFLDYKEYSFKVYTDKNFLSIYFYL